MSIIMIPEVEAREILSNYDGSNNQLLEWKRKFVDVKNFKLTRPQADYVLKYKDTNPKVARKLSSNPKSQIHNGLNSSKSVAATNREPKGLTFLSVTRAIKAPNPIITALSTEGCKPVKPTNTTKALTPQPNRQIVPKRLVKVSTKPRIKAV